MKNSRLKQSFNYENESGDKDGNGLVREVRTKREVSLEEARLAIKANLEWVLPVSDLVERDSFLDLRVKPFLQLVYFKLLGVCLLIYFAIS